MCSKRGAIDLVALGVFLVLTVIIPATVKLASERQEVRTRAACDPRECFVSSDCSSGASCQLGCCVGGGGFYCGDGSCNGSENNGNCPEDCAPPPPPEGCYVSQCQGSSCVQGIWSSNCSGGNCSSDSDCSAPPPHPPPPSEPCSSFDCDSPGFSCSQDGGACLGAKPNCSCTYPQVVCGDGQCQPSESNSNCPADCPVNPPPPCNHDCTNFCGERLNACGEVCNNPCPPNPPTGTSCTPGECGVSPGAGWNCLPNPQQGHCTWQQLPGDASTWKCAGGGNCDKCGQYGWWDQGCFSWCETHSCNKTSGPLTPCGNIEAMCKYGSDGEKCINNIVYGCSPDGCYGANTGKSCGTSAPGSTSTQTGVTLSTTDQVKKYCSDNRLSGVIQLTNDPLNVYDCLSGYKVTLENFKNAAYENAAELYCQWMSSLAQLSCITKYKALIESKITQVPGFSPAANPQVIVNTANTIGTALTHCRGLYNELLSLCMTENKAPIYGIVTYQQVQDKYIDTVINNECDSETERNFYNCSQQKSLLIRSLADKVFTIGDKITKLQLLKQAVSFYPECDSFDNITRKVCMAEAGYPILGQPTSNELAWGKARQAIDSGEHARNCNSAEMESNAVVPYGEDLFVTCQGECLTKREYESSGQSNLSESGKASVPQDLAGTTAQSLIMRVNKNACAFSKGTWNDNPPSCTNVPFPYDQGWSLFKLGPIVAVAKPGENFGLPQIDSSASKDCVPKIDVLNNHPYFVDGQWCQEPTQRSPQGAVGAGTGLTAQGTVGVSDSLTDRSSVEKDCTSVGGALTPTTNPHLPARPNISFPFPPGLP